VSQLACLAKRPPVASIEPSTDDYFPSPLTTMSKDSTSSTAARLSQSCARHGPYALVRHPLYICEEIAIIGIFIQVISFVAFSLVLAHAFIQFRRMLNEEKVLRSTFAEYEHYTAQTLRLVPFR
jgi:protein-S-isoprenylcysteine O-methyltransferase Ste14